MSQKTTLLLGASLVLNVLFATYIALGFVFANQASTATMYKALHDKLCTQDYQKTIDDYDKIFATDPKKASDAKNSFALNVCHRNYKTGQQLNLQPLIDQVR